jgi:hypothetical protein
MEVCGEPQRLAGYALLALIAAGLLCFAAWRLMQAALDADDCGTSLEGLARRGIYAGSALFYLAPLVHPADGVFGSDSRRDAALGNLLWDPNWLLGSGFCWSRRWLGFHNRIGNRLRNIYGFRAGLMSTNHARPP